MREVKYIIVKDKQGKLRHYKSEYLHHYTIARDNGYNPKDILESGLFLEGDLFILESVNEKHIVKHKRQYIGNALNFYQDLRLQNWVRARDLESQLYYSKKLVGVLREGD